MRALPQYGAGVDQVITDTGDRMTRAGHPRLTSYLHRTYHFDRGHSASGVWPRALNSTRTFAIAAQSQEVALTVGEKFRTHSLPVMLRLVVRQHNAHALTGTLIMHPASIILFATHGKVTAVTVASA